MVKGWNLTTKDRKLIWWMRLCSENHRLVIRRAMDVKKCCLGGNPREVTIVNFSCVFYIPVCLLYLSRIMCCRAEQKKLHSKGMKINKKKLKNSSLLPIRVWPSSYAYKVPCFFICWYALCPYAYGLDHKHMRYTIFKKFRASSHTCNKHYGEETWRIGIHRGFRKKIYFEVRGRISLLIDAYGQLGEWGVLTLLSLYFYYTWFMALFVTK